MRDLALARTLARIGVKHKFYVEGIPDREYSYDVPDGSSQKVIDDGLDLAIVADLEAHVKTCPGCTVIETGAKEKAAEVLRKLRGRKD